MMNEGAPFARINEIVAMKSAENILKIRVFGNECGSPNAKNVIKSKPPLISA